MTRITRTLAPALLAIVAATGFAHAQTAPNAQPGPNAPPTATERQGYRPSAETMQRMQDGRFAMIKGALKLSDAQLKLWQPVEELVRTRQADRIKAMQDGSAKRDANAQRPSFADRLEQQSKREAQRAESLKTFAATVRPFYDSLTEEQKAVAGPLMAELSGEHRMHGHRWASHEQHGEHHGGMQQ